MDEKIIITLSDSEDEQKNVLKEDNSKLVLNVSDSDDEFPVVKFDQINGDTSYQSDYLFYNKKSLIEDKSAGSESDEPIDYLPPQKNNFSSIVSEEDEDVLEQKGSKGKAKFTKKSRGDCEEKRLEKEREKIKKQEEKLRKQQEKENLKKQKEDERKEKKKEAERKQAERKAKCKSNAALDTKESLKHMKVIIDKKIKKFDFYESNELLQTLDMSDIKLSETEQLIPGSITWEREDEEYYVNNDNKVCTKKTTKVLKHTVIIWNCEETAQNVSKNSLVDEIAEKVSYIPDHKITLVLYKIEDYLKYLSNKQHHRFVEENTNAHGELVKKKSKTKQEKIYESYQKFSYEDLNSMLLDIQLKYKCCSRLVDTSLDIVAFIFQYTKALAAVPAKEKENQNLSSKLDWYPVIDNRYTVRVDNDGNGLKSYWQQQLCQFVLASLETAEAICQKYPSPRLLLEAYKSCATTSEAENLLKDIPVRRNVAPLQKTRKIGPELSRKVYVMFTSKDGDIYLKE